MLAAVSSATTPVPPSEQQEVENLTTAIAMGCSRSKVFYAHAAVVEKKKMQLYYFYPICYFVGFIPAMVRLFPVMLTNTVFVHRTAFLILPDEWK